MIAPELGLGRVSTQPTESHPGLISSLLSKSYVMTSSQGPWQELEMLCVFKLLSHEQVISLNGQRFPSTRTGGPALRQHLTGEEVRTLKLSLPMPWNESYSHRISCHGGGGRG